MGDRAPAVGVGSGTRSRRGVGLDPGHWGRALRWEQSIQASRSNPQEGVPIMEDPVVQIPGILKTPPLKSLLETLCRYHLSSEGVSRLFRLFFIRALQMTLEMPSL